MKDYQTISMADLYKNWSKSKLNMREICRRIASEGVDSPDAQTLIQCMQADWNKGALTDSEIRSINTQLQEVTKVEGNKTGIKVKKDMIAFYTPGSRKSTEKSVSLEAAVDDFVKALQTMTHETQLTALIVACGRLNIPVEDIAIHQHALGMVDAA